MKGKTNTFSNNLDYSEKLYVTLVTNLTNHSDLNGVIITIKYDNTTESYIWEGREFVINIPVGVEYTISFNEVAGYKTPNSYTYTALLGNRYVKPIYYTELLTVNVSASDGSALEDYEINVNTYTFLEYIEATGTLYIDTGFIVTANTRVVCDFQYTKTPTTTERLFSNENMFGFGFLLSGVFRSWGGTVVNFTANLTERHIVDKAPTYCTLDGEMITTSSHSSVSTYTLPLFANNSSGSITQYSNARIYSCKIYDNDVLVRDYIPAINLDGVIGLYDRANSIFYKSNGTDEFVAGTVIFSGTIVNSNNTYKIPYDLVYTISASSIDGYNTPKPQTIRANLISRTITMLYIAGFSSGTTFEFDYTGSVQEITLPPGSYKLLCWGALGGDASASLGDTNKGIGSKGGYSEGVLTLTETTTLYVFVGGQGSRGSSSSLVNGGWNGGGASVGYSSYNSSGTYGYSYPACGGGATDISTVTSSMSYSSGRTNRSSASLLARCIVAGGGAGGSYRYTSQKTTSSSTVTVFSGTRTYTEYSGWVYKYNVLAGVTLEAGKTYNSSITGSYSYAYWLNSSYAQVAGDATFTPSSSGTYYVAFGSNNEEVNGTTPTIKVTTTEVTTSTSTSSGYSNKSQQGGGTSGKGQYPGTQTSAGSGGGFGYGASQSSTNYRYCGGGGGGGWYGGGTNKSDSSTSYVNYSGGGSGFVNTAANASSRPSGYTGLQLDSGTTTAGSSSFESVSGGTETGHAGNGYARITVL